MQQFSGWTRQAAFVSKADWELESGNLEVVAYRIQVIQDRGITTTRLQKGVYGISREDCGIKWVNKETFDDHVGNLSDEEREELETMDKESRRCLRRTMAMEREILIMLMSDLEIRQEIMDSAVASNFPTIKANMIREMTAMAELKRTLQHATLSPTLHGMITNTIDVVNKWYNKYDDFGASMFWQISRPARWSPIPNSRIDMAFNMSALSSKLCWIAGYVHHVVRVRGRKLLMFCGLPLTLLHVLAFLTNIGFDCLTIRSADGPSDHPRPGPWNRILTPGRWEPMAGSFAGSGTRSVKPAIEEVDEGIRRKIVDPLYPLE